MIGKRLLSGCAVALVLALAACGPNYSPNTYSSTAVQQANKVETGVIVGVRQVDIASPGTTGTVAGAAAGGIAGAAVPESGGVGSALTALGGGLVGGLVGNTVDRKINDTFGYEYIVQLARPAQSKTPVTDGGLPSHELVSVTQKDAVPLTIGTHVLVIAGTQARIVVDYTVPLEPETPAAGDKTATKTEPAPPSKPAAAVAVTKVEPPPATPAVEIVPLTPETVVKDTAPPAPTPNPTPNPTPAVSAAKVEPAAATPPVAIVPLTPETIAQEPTPSADKPTDAAPPADVKSAGAPSDTAPRADPPAANPPPQ